MHFGNPIASLITSGVDFIKGDIRDLNLCSYVVKDIDVIIHLAGIVTDALVDMNPGMARAVNIIGMDGLITKAQKAGVKRFIYASSSSVYGSTLEDATEATPCKPETEYAQIKLDGESMVFAAKGLITCAVRSATCSGPSARMRLDTIVNTFSSQAWFKHYIEVWDGTQWRSNVNVLDIARLYYLLICAEESAINHQIFNATTENHQALELANLVADVHFEYDGGRPEIIVDDTKRDTRQYRMNASKVMKALDWHPQWSIAETIRENFRFFGAGGIVDPDSSLYQIRSEWNV